MVNILKKLKCKRESRTRQIRELQEKLLVQSELLNEQSQQLAELRLLLTCKNEKPETMANREKQVKEYLNELGIGGGGLYGV